MDSVYMYFTKTTYRKTSDNIMVPGDYSFWPELLKHFISRCTNFRIDCWVSDYMAIESAKRYGKCVPCELENIRVFEGMVTKEFIDELIFNPFDKTGKIKWFSVFLLNGESRVINCEHYGSEFITGWLETGDIEFLKSSLLEDFTFHTFEEDELQSSYG